MKRLLLLFGILFCVTCFSAEYQQLAGTNEVVLSADSNLIGASFPEGRVKIVSGTTTLRPAESAAGALLEDSLTNGLSFWLDATQNVVTQSDGTVAQWLDVREEMDANVMSNRLWRFPRAIPCAETQSPNYYSFPIGFYTDETQFPGLRFVDFGEYGSRKWLYFANTNDAVQSVEVRAFFCVVGFQESCGHLLSGASLTGQGGNVYFHKEVAWPMKGYIAADWSCFPKGETRLNGERIDPLKTTYHFGEVQLFSQNGPHQVLSGDSRVTPHAENFFNDRNYTLSGTDPRLRQGGGMIGEMLIYNRVLSEGERRRVEAYLANKWFRSPVCGAVAIHEDARMVVEGDRASALSNLSGDGKLVKRGSGTLSITQMQGNWNGSIRVEEGTISYRQKGEPMTVEPVKGTRLLLTDRAISAETSASGGMEIVANAGETVRLAPTALENDVLTVRGAVLRLQPMAVSASEMETIPLDIAVTNLLTNGGFEDPAFSGTGTFIFPNDGNHPAPWGGWEVSFVNNGDSCALAKNGSAWLNDASIQVPEGLQALSVQARLTSATAKQSFEAPFDGLYELRFQMGRRVRSGLPMDATRILLLLDGVPFYRSAPYPDYRRSDTQGGLVFKPYAVQLPPLKAGTHTLTVSLDTNSTADRAILLDACSIVPLEKGEFVSIPNPGFESCQTIQNRAPNGWFQVSPELAEWGFPGMIYLTNIVQTVVSNVVTSVTTNAYDASCGITQHSSYWVMQASRPGDELRDYRKAFIQRTQYITNTVTFPRDGVVRLSLRYSNRANGDWALGGTGGERPKGHALSIQLDGTEIGRCFPVTQKMRTYRSEFSVRAGTYCLKLQGVTNSWLDCSTIVDDVQMRYLDQEETPLVENGEFIPGHSNVWETVGSGVHEAQICENGDFAMALGGDAGIQQGVEVKEAGYYQLSFGTCGVALSYTVNGPYNNATYYPHEVVLSVDGKEMGRCLSESSEARRFTFALPWLSAGKHLIRIQGVAGAPALARSLIHRIEMSPLAVRSPEVTLYREKTIELTDGAKLDLAFDGLMEVDRLRVNGVSQFGTFTAETAPDFIQGAGVLVARAKGLLLFLK